jgi:hypothetical protein
LFPGNHPKDQVDRADTLARNCPYCAEKEGLPTADEIPLAYFHTAAQNLAQEMTQAGPVLVDAWEKNGGVLVQEQRLGGRNLTKGVPGTKW